MKISDLAIGSKVRNHLTGGQPVSVSPPPTVASRRYRQNRIMAPRLDEEASGPEGGGAAPAAPAPAPAAANSEKAPGVLGFGGIVSHPSSLRQTNSLVRL